MVAHVVERLDHAGARQERLDQFAGGGARVGEVVAYPVDFPPVVHGVDDEFAAQRLHRDAAVLAQGQRQDRHVGLGRGLLRGDRDRAGGEDLHGESDGVGLTRTRDQHPVAGRHREPGQYGSRLSRAQDADRADVGDVHCAPSRLPRGLLSAGRHDQGDHLGAVPGRTRAGSSLSSSRTRGATSRPSGSIVGAGLPGQVQDVVLEVEAAEVQISGRTSDLAGDRLRGPDVERAVGEFRLVACAGRGVEPAFLGQ